MDEAQRTSVRMARTYLRETLGHWKAGTRPGDDPVTEFDVMHAIGELVDAMIDHHRVALHPESAAARAAIVPERGSVARAVSFDGWPIGDVRVEESDPTGDVVGPWWSGTVVAAAPGSRAVVGECLVRLRPCHYAGPAEKA